MRDGEKGPLVIEAVKCRVQARTERKGTGPEELLFVTRERQADRTFKLDYYLSNADPDVPLEELARVPKADIASRSASSGPRGSRAWRTIR